MNLVVSKFNKTRLPYDQNGFKLITIDYTDLTIDEFKEKYAQGLDEARKYLNIEANRKDHPMFFKEILQYSAKNAFLITEMNCKNTYVTAVDYYEGKNHIAAIRIVGDDIPISNIQDTKIIDGVEFTFLKDKFTSYTQNSQVEFEPPAVKPALKNRIAKRQAMDIIHNQAITLAEAMRNSTIEDYIKSYMFGMKGDNTGTVLIKGQELIDIRSYAYLSQNKSSQIKVRHVQ